MGTKPHLFLSQVDNLITWQETHSLSKIPREDCHETRSSVVRGEQSQLIPELVSGKVSVMAHPLDSGTGIVIANRRQAPLCRTVLTPHGASEGKGRGNEREWGTVKGMSGPHRGSEVAVGAELIHLFSSLKISMFSSTGWNTSTFLALQVVTPSLGTCPGLSGRRQIMTMIPRMSVSDTLWEQGVFGGIHPLLCPHSWKPALQKEKWSRSFKISS